MTEGEPGLPALFAHCAVCGAAIRWGDAAVTITRTNERLADDGVAEILDGDWLSSLCAACGPQYPAKAIRITFLEPPLS